MASRAKVEMDGGKSSGRNAVKVKPQSPPSSSSKIPSPSSFKIAVVVIFFFLSTLFMLQYLYVWCGPHNSSGSPDNTFKTLFCAASQRYSAFRPAYLLQSFRSCKGDDEDAGVQHPDAGSWRSQWERRNLSWSVYKPSPPPPLPDMLQTANLRLFDTRRIPVLGGFSGQSPSCARAYGPVMLSVTAPRNSSRLGTLSCPVLWHCRQPGGTPKVQAVCWDSKFFDAIRPSTLPTEGSFITPAFGQMFVKNRGENFNAVSFIANVFSNQYAQVFDAEHLFLKGGCWEQRASEPLFRSLKETKISRHQLCVNLGSNHASSQFHGLVELLARMALLLPVIQALPSATVLLAERDEPHVSTFFRLMGVGSGLQGINVHLVKPTELVYADMMVVAQCPPCGQSSRAMWHHLRQQYLRVGQSALRTSAADDDDSGWYMVLAERKGTRNIVQHEELLAGLVAALGESRVKLFSDRLDWTMEATRQLFQGASIFVAGHGAGLSNMVFMPHRSSVVEVRPSNFSNACYHGLADALDFHYYRFDSPGVKSSSLLVDVEQVVTLVSAIVQAKGRPVHFYDQLQGRRRRRRRA